jgi:hypothetical protein
MILSSFLDSADAMAPFPLFRLDIMDSPCIFLARPEHLVFSSFVSFKGSIPRPQWLSFLVLAEQPHVPLPQTNNKQTKDLGGRAQYGRDR